MICSASSLYVHKARRSRATRERDETRDTAEHEAAQRGADEAREEQRGGGQVPEQRHTGQEEHESDREDRENGESQDEAGFHAHRVAGRRLTT